MTQSPLSTPNSGLRVFSASLLSALLITMPFVQMAAAEKRSEVRGQRSESGRPAANEGQQDRATNGASENVFLNAPIPKPAPEPPALAPVIVATKDDGLATAATVAPGGTINYSVNIKNNGALSPGDDAANVQFTDQIDSHTTLVAGSAVAAVSDKYNTIGNVQLSIPDGATDLLGNDLDPDTGNNTGMTVTGETKSSTQCTGGCSNNVTINADGSFTYDPPVGFAGTDTFTYTAHSTVGSGTATETVTITVANEIWFINNNAGACPGAPCDGRLSHPFTSLPAFTAANLGGAGQPGDNDWIFVYESAADYAGPATLRNGQKFIGQDATASLATLTGFPAPSGADQLPVMNSGNGTFVNIAGTNVNGINLLSGNTLRGFRVGSVGTGTKISGTSFGTLVVGNSGSPDVLLNGTGRALNLTTGTLSVTGGFVSVTTTSSATQGISLSGVADSDGAGVGAFSFGSTTVSGSTTQGILIATTPADLNFGITSVTGGTSGVSFQSNSGGTRTFVTLGISGGANEAFLHGAGGGNVTVTGAATLSSTGSAVSVSAPGASNVINFQAATSATSTGAGIAGVNWAGAAGATLTFNSLSITRNNGTALNASGGGTINVTNATGSITNTTSGGPAIVAANIALNANFSSINSSAGANGVSLTSVTGTSNLGTGQLTGTISGATFLVNSGTASVTYSGAITQAAAAPMVSIIDHGTGTILFQTGTLLASLGTGISLDNADGTYNFTGTTNLAGGNAHIDISDGSAGAISFGANTTITNPSGVAVNVDGSGVLNPVTGGITIAGSISKNTGGRLIDFNDYDTGTANISATLSCTAACDGVEVTNDATSSGTVNFTAATKTLNTATDNAVQLDNNDNGNINFTGGGLDIDTTTGIGFNAINGGTVTVTGSGNSLNSVSAAALTITSTNIGANDVIFERIDSGNNTAAADPASGIVLNSTGSAGGLNVTGTGTTDGSGGTIQSTTADAISLTTTSSVVLKNMIIGDNAAVHTEGVSLTNNIGDDGIASTAVTPVAGDTYGLDIDNLKIARTAGGGIDGAGGGNIGLHVNNTEIINPGDAGTPSSTSSDEDAIGYGSGFAGNADQITGTVLIENSTFAAMIDHGIQVENSGSGTLNMTVSNVTMKNNDALTHCSGGPCEGSAIQVIADGSTVAGGAGPTINLTVRQLTATNIDQDVIDAIADPGGNINVTVGDPANNATNGITSNCPNGDQVLRFNSGSPDSDDTATFNFNVRNVIVSQSPGTLVIFKAANSMTGKFINSTLDQNSAVANTLASRGIEITADGDASGGANEVPAMTILIDNVTLNRIGGDGIQAFMTDVTNASSRLDLTIQNCNIGTNPANTAQTGLEIGLNNSLASEAIEIRNGVTTTNNGQLYAHISNNNIRNATSLSGSADGIDIDAEFLSTSHVTVVNNDIFAAPGTTDYDLAVEANTAFMCADFTGNNDSNDANAGADITNIGAQAADFQIEGGSASLAGNNPGTSPFNMPDVYSSGTCTMPNTPSGAFFALNNQSNQQIYVASLTTKVANELPAGIFASAENALNIATLPATGATVTQPSLVNQVANVLAHSASETGARIAPTALAHSVEVSSQRPEVSNQKSEIRTHHAPSSKLETRNTTRDEDTGLRAHYATLSKLATRSATAAPAPMSGETVTANFPTLPAGGSVTITFQVTVNNPPNLTLLAPPRVENQGTVTANGGINVLTDDPNVVGAADKTATRIDLFDTTTSLVSDINPSNDGDTVTFTATINETPVQGSVNPTGTVDFIDTSNGNAVICNDVAVGLPCQVSNLSAGSTHNIRADYSGDGNFDSSQSNIVAQVVNACLNNPVVINTADSGAGSLREALTTVCSAPNNNITFNIPIGDPGFSGGIYTITVLTELAATKNVNITGPNSVTNTNPIVVSGNNATRVFKINSGKTVTMTGFTVTGGSVLGSGAGILNDHGTLTLNNMTISGNAGSGGGGVYVDGNSGSASLTVTNSTISGNTVTASGGGIHANGSGLGTTTLIITNSTISGNTANVHGGGLYLDETTSTLTNVTITNNRGDNDDVGSGSSGGMGIVAGATTTLHNTIVAGNFRGTGSTRDDINGALDAASTNNLIGDGTDMTGITHGVNGNQVGTGVTPIVAMLGSLANNGGPTFTHALSPTSPAVEAGSNTAATTAGLTTDQRGTGFPRTADSADPNTTQTVDIGAFELHPTVEDITDKTTAEDTAVPQITFNLGDGTGALIGTVTATSGNTTLVPNANILVGGSGSTRTLDISPAADANTPADGTATITVTVTATNGQTAVDTFVLTVTDVNDNPDAVNDSLTAVDEDSGLRIIPFTDLTGNDTKGAANESGQTLTVTAVSNPTGGSVVINGTNVEFTVAANFSGTASFDYTITDNGTTNGVNDFKSDTATASFAVNAINDPPSFTIAGNPPAVNEDAGAQTVNGFATGISSGPGESQTLTFNLTPTGTTGNLSFSSGPAINSTTGALTYTTNADTNGTASFSVTLSDNGSNVPPNSNTSGTQSFTITVNAVNDAPSFSLAGNPPAVNEDAGAQTVNSFATNFQPGPVTATDEGTQTLVGYTLTPTGTTGGLTFSGTPAIDTAGTLTYTATNNTSGTATFDAVATDTGSNTPPNVNQSAPVSFTITVNAANDPPINTVPGPQGTASNTALTFSSGNGNQISVADVDAGTNTVQVTLSVTNGTLTLSGTTGLSFAFADGNGTGAGDGTADATMTFRGTLTDINNALNGMTFNPTAGYSGPATLTIVSNDLGNTGTGGALSDTDVVNIQVATEIRVNDAKVTEPPSATTNMLFTVTLNVPAPAGGVSVNYATAPVGGGGDAIGGASCTPGVDYIDTSGTLNFTLGQQLKIVPVQICADTQPEGIEAFVLNLPGATGGTIVDNQGLGHISDANPAGAVLISELRTSGPGGAGDDFVELYNNTNSAMDISGYGLFKMGATCTDTPVLIATMPGASGSNTTVIPPRGHYLLVGSQYSLNGYPSGNSGATATGDQTLTADIETDANVGLFSTSTVGNISSANRLDAVGFGLNTGGVCDLLREGSTLPPIAGNATIEHSYFRKMCDWIQGSGCTVPGVPKDTNDNSVDFWLADTAGSAITGRLGAPGPENLASPIRRDNANNPGSGGINVFLLDSTIGSAAGANRDRNGGDPAGTFGSMKLRYRVTNNTGVPVTRLRYRIVDMSTAIQPAGPTADLRALTGIDEDIAPGNDPPVGPVHDSVTCTAGGAGAPPCTVTVTATTLETPPAQAIGGGYNSTLSSGTITTVMPLNNGQSILINFKLGVEKTGQFRFYIIVEALP